jgi:SAM-dependent methyltransferase/anti-sigma regulatory factor (Ser/Thr protein kinase)
VSHGVLGHDPASRAQFSSLRHGSAEKAGLVHTLLMYRGREEYLDAIVRFIRHARAIGEPVLVAVPGERMGLVQARLGASTDRVCFVDMADAGGNPGRIIPKLLCGFVDEHRTGRMRVVSESVWPGRSEAEYPGCVQHEALVNLAFADRPVTILCPYDADGLDPPVLADAVSTHPMVVEHGEWRSSPGFADPARVFDAWNRPLPEPQAVPSTLVFTAPHGPRQVRRLTYNVAAQAGLTGRRLTDLLLAVNELSVNTLLHTRRSGLFSIWCADGQVVCQVQDSGHITDRLAGRRCPARHDTDSHGLRLVNNLCDLVRIHTRRGETTVRLHMQLSPCHDAAAHTVAAIEADDVAAGRARSVAMGSSRPPGHEAFTGPPAPPQLSRDEAEPPVSVDMPSDPATLHDAGTPPAPTAEPNQIGLQDSPSRHRAGASAVAAVAQQPAYAHDAGLYEARSEVFHHWRRRLVERLQPGPGDVVLDVGCGTGLCFALLQEWIGTDGTIIGIDASPTMLELARQRSAAHGWNNVVLIEAAAEDAVIPQVADHALFCAVHDILQSPTALRNILARVRPGGSVAAVGGKWAPPWAIGLNALVATTHAPFVRDFTGFDRPWALLSQHLTNLKVREIEMGCGYLVVGKTPPLKHPGPPESIG